MVEKEIALACQGVKIRDISTKEFGLFMTGLIGKTFLNCGQPVQEMILDATIDELCADLQKYNGLLTCEEIKIAFSNGYKKQYGEFYGLNNSTYFTWVNAYTWNISRTNAKKAIENAKNKPVTKPEISDQEKEKIIVDGILESFESFKNCGKLTGAPAVHFVYLEKLGLLKLSVERKKEISNEVSARIRLEILENKKRTKSIEEALKDGLNEDIIKFRSRIQALMEYFQSCVEMEIDLSGEIEQIKNNLTL